MMPDGGFAAGVPEDYSFEIRRPDGSVTVVQKYWEPAPVNPGELEMETRQMRFVISGRSPEIDWTGMDIPETKPAYSGLVAARDGRVFVQPSSEITVNDECLDPNLTNEYIDGDALWLSLEDDLGTVMVKRYRLVPPRDPADS